MEPGLPRRRENGFTGQESRRNEKVPPENSTRGGARRPRRRDPSRQAMVQLCAGRRRMEVRRLRKSMRINLRAAIQLLMPLLFIGSITDARRQPAKQPRRHSAREINKVARPESGRPIAIVGAKLIDGRGGAPVNDSVVVIRDERIMAAGARNST